jgi:hypothetical protein
MKCQPSIKSLGELKEEGTWGGCTASLSAPLVSRRDGWKALGELDMTYEYKVVLRAEWNGLYGLDVVTSR